MGEASMCDATGERFVDAAVRDENIGHEFTGAAV